jgi:16S rRNA (cytidine1402-2'-O)-methyltransferase
MATLFVVATPIGNLGDMTHRALQVLSSVSVIAAEDTRVTRKLLQHYDIHNSVISYHAQSTDSARDSIINRLESGEDIALVTDAGTPGISDPGTELVAHARAAGIAVVAVPGASALTAALSIAGIPTNEFIFLGFLPHKKGRQTLFAEIAASKRTVVFYESPHRIMKTLASLSEVLDTQKVSVFRELTKMYEEVVQGSAAEILSYFEENTEHVRGEFVVAVSSK